ncbi:MAG: hypothetical protein MAG471_00717 [Acidimicrobiaceae bacterium]|nr:hypothetical protein [Acidimicrobiaceae bacterium]
MGCLAVRVHRCADQASGEHPLVPFRDRHEARVRPTEAHRHPETLGGSHDYVHSEFSGWCHQAEGQEVGGHSHTDTCLTKMLHDTVEGSQASAGPRKRDQRPEHVVVTRQLEGPRIGHLNSDTERPGAGPDHLDHLWVTVGVHEEGVAVTPMGPLQQGHCLGSRGCLVEEGCVGQVHSRQVGDHRLETQEHLEPSLGYLSLIRRVRGVPGWILEHIAGYDGRHVGVVPAGTDEACNDRVAVGKGAESSKGLLFTDGSGEVERASVPDRLRDDRVDQVVQVGGADHLEHPGDRSLVRAEVAPMERRIVEELGQGREWFARVRHLSGVHSG